MREEIEKLQIPSSRQKHEGAKRHNSRVFVRWLSWWLCGRFSAAKNNENPKPEDIPMKIPIARISIWMFYGPKPNPPSSSLFHASYVRRLRAQPHQHPPTAQHQPTSMPPAQHPQHSAHKTQIFRGARTRPQSRRYQRPSPPWPPSLPRRPPFLQPQRRRQRARLQRTLP